MTKVTISFHHIEIIPYISHSDINDTVIHDLSDLSVSIKAWSNVTAQLHSKSSFGRRISFFSVLSFIKLFKTVLYKSFIFWNFLMSHPLCSYLLSNILGSEPSHWELFGFCVTYCKTITICLIRLFHVFYYILFWKRMSAWLTCRECSRTCW